MPRATINGIQMHYQQKGDGPDVVLVHGITSSLAMWYMYVLPGLADGFRVTIYDLRGHGRSGLTPTGYTSAEMAEDLHALLDHLDIEKASLVGHSFGGSVILHYAVMHPERVHALMPLDVSVQSLRHLRRLEDWPGWTLWQEQLAKYGISADKFRDDPERVIRKSFEIPVQFGLRKGEQRSTKRLLRLLNETTVVRDFRDPAELTPERLKEIQAPTLLVYGETSPYLKIGDYLQENLPNCAVYTLREAGHMYIIQKSNAFLELLNGFLKDPEEYVRACNASKGEKPMKRFKSVIRFKLEPDADANAFADQIKALASEGKSKLAEHGLLDIIIWQPGETNDSEYDLDVEFVWQSKEHREKLREAGGGGGAGMQSLLAIIQNPAVSERSWDQYVER